MRIYISHSKDYDFVKELYNPLRKSELDKNNEIVFPHEKSDEPFNSKDFLKNSCDLIIAGVSFQSIGVGIELGWADLFNVQILCIYKKSKKPGKSLKVLTNNFIEYANPEDMILKLSKFIKNN